jgi:hypothetical protein
MTKRCVTGGRELALTALATVALTGCDALESTGTPGASLRRQPQPRDAARQRTGGARRPGR